MHAALFAAEVLPESRGSRCPSLLGDVLDYRETGAQPVIEVSTVENAEGADWFDLHIAVSIENEVVPFEELFVALSQRQDYLILNTGVYFSLDRPELDQLRNLIEEARALQDRDRPTLRISRFQVGLWDELIKLGVVVGQAERWISSVRALSSEDQTSEGASRWHPCTPQGDAPAVPVGWVPLVAPALGPRPWRILADDMGLGKTVQALALICHARLAASADAPFLVVAPTSVVSNWATEADRFAPICRWSPLKNPRLDAAGRWPRPLQGSMSWSRPTHCCGSTQIPTLNCRGLGWSSTRHSSSRTTGPRLIRVPVGCNRTSSSRSPAPRWKTI